jgi:hypothetical protein
MLFTNSAGESILQNIILAVLLSTAHGTYGNDYKGGILLIDEIDATLMDFARKAY